ncbi:hypothetical protein HZY83_02855 [Gemella sp. GH3]|uniref:hypothetical protein n=1 Tax=unclassified Gemella TaxID=2624949 RepID=UPI0015D00424|nr:MULTISPECIES: hypothetical protein [unclassified Gemella]MBF0713620.1 hypothetical protein [Gemella sp. GH3.1]NYS50572.1 hypothetical protein [Gemella sp. GH3]
MLKNYKSYLPNIVAIVYTVLLAIIISLSLNSNPLSNFELSHDSAMFQYFGYAMDKGFIVYKDIFDHKGPFIFIFNYIAIVLGKYGLYLVELFFLTLFLIFVYKTAKLYVNLINSLIITTLVSLFIPYLYEGGNTVEEYATPFMMISLYIFSKYFLNKEVTNIHIILLGISFSIVALIRFNMISIWCIFVLVILINLISKQEYKLLINYIFNFIIGILIIFLPLGIYLYVNNALYEAFYQSFIFNMYYIGDGESILHVLRSFSLRPVIIMMCVVFGSSLIFINYKDKYHLAIVGSIILTSVSVLLSKRDYPHYLLALLPLMAASLVFIFQKITFNFKYLLAILILSFPIIMDNFIIFSYRNVTSYSKIASSINEVQNMTYNNELNMSEIQKVSEYVRNNTNNEDLIYTHRLSGNIYLESDRLANTKYFALPATDVTNNEKVVSEFFESMNNSRPKLLVVYRSFAENEQEGFELDFQKYILNNYKVVYETDSYLVYK